MPESQDIICPFLGFAHESESFVNRLRSSEHIREAARFHSFKANSSVFSMSFNLSHSGHDGKSSIELKLSVHESCFLKNIPDELERTLFPIIDFEKEDIHFDEFYSELNKKLTNHVTLQNKRYFRNVSVNLRITDVQNPDLQGICQKFTGIVQQIIPCEGSENFAKFVNKRISEFDKNINGRVPSLQVLPRQTASSNIGVAESVNTVDKMKDHISNLEKTNKSAVKEIERQDDEISENKTQLKAKDAEIAQLRSELKRSKAKRTKVNHGLPGQVTIGGQVFTPGGSGNNRGI